ncbi:hypothetical protein RCZ04_17970 [Capnocytophaga sp. HP1101]
MMSLCIYLGCKKDSEESTPENPEEPTPKPTTDDIDEANTIRWDFATRPNDWVLANQGEDKSDHSSIVEKDGTTDGKALQIYTNANSHERKKLKTTKQFGSGIYQWQMFVPVFEKASRGSVNVLLYNNDSHELDIKIASGTESDRQAMGLTDDEVIATFVIQGEPLQEQKVKITGNAWHTFKIDLKMVDQKYQATFYVDNTAYFSKTLPYGEDYLFHLFCSVENVESAGNFIPNTRTYGWWDYISYTPYTYSAKPKETVVNADTPTDIKISAANLMENVVGATVGTLTTIDKDSKEKHTYTVNDERFEVVNGVLKLKANQKVFFAETTQIILDITTTNTKKLSFSKKFIITVQDDPNYPAPKQDNTAPTNITLSSINLMENVAGAQVGVLTVIDKDVNDTHTYRLSDARFEVVGNILKLKPTQKVFFADEKHIPLSITATDSGGLFFEKKVVLHVIDDPNFPAPTAKDYSYKTNFTSLEGWIADNQLPSGPPNNCEIVSNSGCDDGKGLRIWTDKDSKQRKKQKTVKRYGAGTYTWKVYIPNMIIGERASVGSWLYSDDHHEVDFEVGSGTVRDRKLAGATSNDQLIPYITSQDSIEVHHNTELITAGDWHTFEIELKIDEAVNGKNYIITWSIDGKPRHTAKLNYGQEVKFHIYCSVENLDFLGERTPTVENYGIWDYVKYEPFEYSEEPI